VKAAPERLRGYYGAAKAAAASGDKAKAIAYYRKLDQLTKSTRSDRPELKEAKLVCRRREAPGGRIARGRCALRDARSRRPDGRTGRVGADRPRLCGGQESDRGEDWTTANRTLSSAALRDTRTDIQNYLGFAYRRAGEMKQAFEHYERALKLNPRHRGAHEYVGEAY